MHNFPNLLNEVQLYKLIPSTGSVIGQVFMTSCLLSGVSVFIP